jgi:hypothetical protein
MGAGVRPPARRVLFRRESRTQGGLPLVVPPGDYAVHQRVHPGIGREAADRSAALLEG